MPSALPDGEPVPPSGVLPDGVVATSPFGVYVHVPFCRTRCGYCDFNTYPDLGGLQASYAGTVAQELQLARRVLGVVPPVETVFVGGGTPTLLPAADLALMLMDRFQTAGCAITNARCVMR